MRFVPNKMGGWKEIHLLYYGAPIAMTLRSGVTSALMGLCTVGFCGAAKTPPAKYLFRSAKWDDMKEQYGYGTLTALGVAGCKVVFWHLCSLSASAVALRLRPVHELGPVGVCGSSERP